MTNLTNGIPFNPLDKKNLGESVAEALLFERPTPLAQIRHLVGAGVYAIYYTGNFEAYSKISEKNRNEQFDQPIYVGKAVPKGSRKGGFYLKSAEGTPMRDRLRNHGRSIEQSKNLDLNDFVCRALMVDDIWIPLGESMMIEKFQPVWNRLIDGFGNQTPGKRRETQFLSRWDTLHPGRKAFQRLPPGPFTASSLEKLVFDFFAGKPVPLVAPEDAVDPDGSDDDSG